MENKIYNDDVERIVNDPERVEAINAFHHKRQARKQRKILSDGVVYASIAIAFAVIGSLGWLTAWIANPVAAACALYSAFCFGRYFENGKRWGWH
jgi:hypothetical protein